MPAGFYLALFFAGAVWLTIRLARNDPALLAERMREPAQKDQPLGDKILRDYLLDPLSSTAQQVLVNKLQGLSSFKWPRSS
ncbi:MAG: hypothetical protein P4L56_18570 [Candidatus Sulfopaludibacter sp.]|nr:hypothetical protein [Candidatus Sulfopaludibacter sp.]